MNSSNFTSDLEQWLKKLGLRYELSNDTCIVDGEYGKWLICLDILKRGKQPTLKSKIMSCLMKIDGTNNKTSFYTEYDIYAVTQWKEIPQYVKEKLNITLITYNSKNGHIKEYK